jgi:hypothetical protein
MSPKLRSRVMERFAFETDPREFETNPRELVVEGLFLD